MRSLSKRFWIVSRERCGFVQSYAYNSHMYGNITINRFFVVITISATPVGYRVTAGFFYPFIRDQQRDWSLQDGFLGHILKHTHTHFAHTYTHFRIIQAYFSLVFFFSLWGQLQGYSCSERSTFFSATARLNIKLLNLRVSISNIKNSVPTMNTLSLGCFKHEVGYFLWGGRMGG